MTPRVGKCQARPRGFAQQAEGPAMSSDCILHTVEEVPRPIPPNLMNPCHKFCPGSGRGGCWHRAKRRGAALRGPEETAGRQALCKELVNQQSVKAPCRRDSPASRVSRGPGAQVNTGRRGGGCSESTWSHGILGTQGVRVQ